MDKKTFLTVLITALIAVSLTIFTLKLACNNCDTPGCSKEENVCCNKNEVSEKEEASCNPECEQQCCTKKKCELDCEKECCA